MDDALAEKGILVNSMRRISYCWYSSFNCCCLSFSDRSFSETLFVATSNFYDVAKSNAFYLPSESVDVPLFLKKYDFFLFVFFIIFFNII